MMKIGKDLCTFHRLLRLLLKMNIKINNGLVRHQRNMQETADGYRHVVRIRGDRLG